MVTAAYVPRRGDLVWLHFDPQTGHEQVGHGQTGHEQPGRRLAVVLSPESSNGRVGLAVFCPVTSQAKGYPFEVPLPSGSEISGVILSDQVKSMDWRARRADLIESLPPEITDEVLAKLGTLLD